MVLNRWRAELTVTEALDIACLEKRMGDAPSDSDFLSCHRCGVMLTRGDGSFYVVRIDAFADPSPPDIDANEPIEDFAAEWERLLDQMRDMSERELVDQVYRRMTIQLCAGCYRSWIENPTG